jgi:general secretion pathway protein G
MTHIAEKLSGTSDFAAGDKLKRRQRHRKRSTLVVAPHGAAQPHCNRRDVDQPGFQRGRGDRVATGQTYSISARNTWRIRAFAQRAFTLTELLIALAVIGILAAIGIPYYADYKERIRVEQAVADILGMSALIMYYANDNRAPPASLAEVRLQGKLDPWGRPYVYTNLMTANGNGDARKDKNLNPLNSDFDLYSVGKDGETRKPLSPKESHDDVIRARDGRFVGLAKDFDP